MLYQTSSRNSEQGDRQAPITVSNSHKSQSPFRGANCPSVQSGHHRRAKSVLRLVTSGALPPSPAADPVPSTGELWCVQTGSVEHGETVQAGRRHGLAGSGQAAGVPAAGVNRMLRMTGDERVTWRDGMGWDGMGWDEMVWDKMG